MEVYGYERHADYIVEQRLYVHWQIKLSSFHVHVSLIFPTIPFSDSFGFGEVSRSG
jgi:hypothetical protein